MPETIGDAFAFLAARATEEEIHSYRVLVADARELVIAMFRDEIEEELG